jgi:hypothetical protein
MKRFLIHILFIAGLISVSSCDFDELLDNPNEVTAASTNADFLLNRIQVDFMSFYQGTSDRGQRVTRIRHQASDTYEISHQPVFQNGTWSSAYASILNDIKSLKDLAERGGFLRHLAIAQTIEAYVWMVLVDTYGDVPFSQALDPANFNPGRDPGATVYNAALNLLNEAKSNFANSSSLGAPNDFFYNRDYARWTRLVNTLLLRYHLNLRLIDNAGSTAAINTLIAENNFLQTGDDFIWRYGVSLADPFSINPEYNGQYPNGGGSYQSVFYMWHLTEAKGFDDPRAKFYFYRQVGANPTSGSQVRCIEEFLPAHYPIDMVWCMPGTRGYWGRDHLDPQGIPPDNLGRTLFGIYPAGGSFDNDNPAPMSAANRGALGAGIEPIMLAAFVDFMLAEAHLMLKEDPAAAKASMLSGAEKHINFVRSWALTTAEAAKITAYQDAAAFNASRDQYLAKIEQDYDMGASQTDRMRIIAREYWISLYGSGNEAYNLYRRTGQPDNMQPGQIPDFGSFPRTFFYPSDHVNLNSNAEQKASHDVKVFWDNNPDGFID